MKLSRGGRLVLSFLLLDGALRFFAQDLEDWSKSPEAYFLTREERDDWRKLGSRESRHAFIERYWLKRDPTPGTETNQFRDLVLSRIKTADARFKIAGTPGSRTARGLVFIVLGSPARIQDQNSPKPPPDPPGGRRLGEGVTPVAVAEGNETTSTWYYEPDRTPRILEVIKRSSLQIRIVVEPSRRIDAIQEPGLFDEIRETVARATIVNPDLVPPSGGAPSLAALAVLPHQAVSPAVRKLLEEAPAVSRREGAFVGSAVVFRNSGEAETLFWAYSPRPSRKPLFHLLVRDAAGRETAVVSEPAGASSEFSTRAPGLVAVKRLTIPPGSYSAAVAMTDEEGGSLLAAGILPVQVPAVDKGFGVSSLLITRGPAAPQSGQNPIFNFGGTVLPPRADASFTPAESLWYFIEVANPTDLAKVMIEPRLRRGGQPMAGLPPFAAKLQTMGENRFLAGVEMPLATLDPGDYVLYLTVRDGDTEDRPSVLRRADFQIVR